MVGDCEPIVTLVTQQRSARVNVLALYQSKSQVLRLLSGGREFVENCAWWIAGGLNDTEFLTQVSKLIGNKKVKVTSTSKGKHGSSESEHLSETPLATVDFLKNLPDSEAVLVLKGHAAIVRKPYHIVEQWVKGKLDRSVRYY